MKKGTIRGLLHYLAAIDDVDALLQVVERRSIHLAAIEAINGIFLLNSNPPLRFICHAEIHRNNGNIFSAYISDLAVAELKVLRDVFLYF